MMFRHNCNTALRRITVTSTRYGGDQIQPPLRSSRTFDTTRPTFFFHHLTQSTRPASTTLSTDFDLVQSSTLSSSNTSFSINRRPADNYNTTRSSVSYYSSTSLLNKSGDDSSSSGGITGWMNNRREKQEQEKYAQQMEKLADMERLTMKEYHSMLEDGVGGFMTNISFLQTSEIKVAKAVVDVVSKIIDVVGPDATADDLIEMDRLQRLKVATAANKTPEEISIMVSQITNMDVMQKALRKRKLEGKKIPQDQDQMQAIIKKDALEVMSKAQKNMMKGRQENYAKRMARRKAGR